MNEINNLKAAREELLSSFGLNIKESNRAWEKFEIIDKRWTFWKDGCMKVLFVENENLEHPIREEFNTRNIEQYDNADYVLLIVDWSKEGTKHINYVVLPKSKMVDSLPGIEKRLYGRKPFQIMFTSGVENSCSLNHS